MVKQIQFLNIYICSSGIRTAPWEVPCKACHPRSPLQIREPRPCLQMPPPPNISTSARAKLCMSASLQRASRRLACHVTNKLRHVTTGVPRGWARPRRRRRCRHPPPPPPSSSTTASPPYRLRLETGEFSPPRDCHDSHVSLDRAM